MERDLEQRAQEANNSFPRMEEEIRAYRRRSFRKLMLYGIVPVILLTGAYIYLTQERTRNKLDLAYQQCKRSDDLNIIRDTPVGRYSCKEIKEWHIKLNK